MSLAKYIHNSHLSHRPTNSARSFSQPKTPSVSQVSTFHSSLPNFQPTPLIHHPSLASSLGIGHVFIKSEISRLGLPAFKILGASYATYRHLRRLLSSKALTDDDATTLSDIATAAKEAGLILTCATDGNHGRAIAYMAKLLGIEAKIYYPSFMPPSAQAAIKLEGATLIGVQGDYDTAVLAALRASQDDEKVVLVQDNSIPELNDDSVATWIVAGYGTILQEIDASLSAQNLKPDLVVMPVGVGSLAQTVVMHYKPSRTSDSISATKPELKRPKVMTVEPIQAACLQASVTAGEPTTIYTGHSIMTGLCCGSVSPLAWPYLKAGVDYAATVDDWGAHLGVEDMREIGIDAGPIPGGCLAVVGGLEGRLEEFGLTEKSVVVVIATEGRRQYDVPERPIAMGVN